MKRKILIHSIVFSPDGVSTAYLYNDIARKFVENNYEVVVLTTTPHYNIVDSEIAKQALQAKMGGLYYESNYHGIKVLHVPQKKHKSTLLRIVGFVYWHILSFVLGLAQKNVDVILSPSPPLTIGLVSLIIAKLKNAKVIYNVQEIYPDFLINQGILKSGVVIRLLKWLERFVYNNSDAVTTIDSTFHNSIVGRFEDKSKLHIIPNFVDTDVYKPISSADREINEKIFPPDNHNLKIMYAGNIGYAQDWAPLIEVAKKLVDKPVDFYIIGEGVQRSYVESEVARHQLANVHVIGYQPRETIPSIISYADIHFIFMTAEMEKQGFPSKVYTIMACAKPLLIISGEDTPLNKFLDATDTAYIITGRTLQEKTEQVLNVIEKLLINSQPLQQMGDKAFTLIQNQYSKNRVTSQYVSLVNALLGK